MLIYQRVYVRHDLHEMEIPLPKSSGMTQDFEHSELGDLGGVVSDS
jgi:hypothetical protein